MPQTESPTDGKPLDTDKLTWTVLLGRWIEFARSALALPNNEIGRALRGSVADIIGLQAVWFALQHLNELDAGEQALGLARAEVLIEHHTSAISRHWRDKDLPAELSRLITDVRQALAKSREQ